MQGGAGKRYAMLKMNFWDAKWDLDEAQCPCDIHFNHWVDANAITGKTIYHFGTGTHHIVGLTQAANGSNNVVFAPIYSPAWNIVAMSSSGSRRGLVRYASPK